MYYLPEPKTSSNYLALPRRDRISDGEKILANCTVNDSQLKNGWQLGEPRNQRSPNFNPINQIGNFLIPRENFIFNYQSTSKKATL